jgi:hypothetical protein
VHDAFKADDGEDFNNYISKPFLTSAEQDKLIVQLRESGFFDKFVYDAQKADWFVPTAEEKAATDAKAVAAPAAAIAASGTPGGVAAGGSSTAADSTVAPPPVVALGSGSLLSKKNKEAFKEATATKALSMVVVEWTHPVGTGEKALAAFLGGAHGADAVEILRKEFAEPPFPAGADLVAKAGLVFSLLSKPEVVADPALSEARKDTIGGLYNCVLMDQNTRKKVLNAIGRDSLNYAALVAIECPAAVGNDDVFHEAEQAITLVVQIAAMQAVGKEGEDRWLNTEKSGWVVGSMEKLLAADFAADKGRASAKVLATFLNSMQMSWVQPPGPPVATAPMLFNILALVPSIAAKKTAVSLMKLWKSWSVNIDYSPHVATIFAMMDQGYEEACLANELVPSLNMNDPAVSAGLMHRIGLVARMAEDNQDLDWQHSGRGVGSVLLRLAVGRKTATVQAQLPFISNCLEDCTKPQESKLLDVLVTLADTRADIVYPLLLDLQEVMETADTGVYGVGGKYASIVGDCGALSIEYTKQTLPLLLRELRKPDLPTHDATAYLSQVGRLCHGRKELLELDLTGDLLGAAPAGSTAGDVGTEVTLLSVCRRWVRSSDGATAAAAELVIAHFEGRDAEAMALQVTRLEEQCEEENAKISKACSDFEQVREYMEENVASLKTFIADVAKKLPNPVKFSVVGGKIKKVIKLHFVCPKTGFEFCTESSDWNKVRGRLLSYSVSTCFDLLSSLPVLVPHLSVGQGWLLSHLPRQGST